MAGARRCGRSPRQPRLARRADRGAEAACERRGNERRRLVTALHVGIVTLFPSLLEAFASTSIVGRAVEAELLALHLEDLRAHGVGRYKSVDDTPYGGGSGMVLRADCVVAAMEAAAARLSAPVTPQRVLLTPQGERFTQRSAEELAAL